MVMPVRPQRVPLDATPLPAFTALGESRRRSPARSCATSPITAYAARDMIGASGSLLIARIRFADLQPTMCWIAPLMPQAMYRSGAIRMPVWPICSECGRQPAVVTTRDTPTAPPSSSGEVLEHREALGASDAATAADDDPGIRQRHLVACRRDPAGDANPQVGVSQVRGHAA